MNISSPSPTIVRHLNAPLGNLPARSADRGFSGSARLQEELNRSDNPASRVVIKSPVERAVTGEKSFSFGDFLDIINPLQHIPVVNNIYRAITHDEIKAPARILGGGLFGGLVGAAMGLVNSIFSKVTGKDIGEHVLAMFKNDDGIALQREKSQIASLDHGTDSLPTDSNTDLSRDLIGSVKMRALYDYQCFATAQRTVSAGEKERVGSMLDLFH